MDMDGLIISFPAKIVIVRRKIYRSDGRTIADVAGIKSLTVLEPSRESKEESTYIFRGEDARKSWSRARGMKLAHRIFIERRKKISKTDRPVLKILHHYFFFFFSSFSSFIPWCLVLPFLRRDPLEIIAPRLLKLQHRLNATGRDRGKCRK